MTCWGVRGCFHLFTDTLLALFTSFKAHLTAFNSLGLQATIMTGSHRQFIQCLSFHWYHSKHGDLIMRSSNGMCYVRTDHLETQAPNTKFPTHLGQHLRKAKPTYRSQLWAPQKRAAFPAIPTPAGETSTLFCPAVTLRGPKSGETDRGSASNKWKSFFRYRDTCNTFIFEDEDRRELSIHCLSLSEYFDHMGFL